MTTPTTPSPSPTKKRRLLVRGLQALAGLAAGLFIAEGAFYARDSGAFPHLNVYVPDARLGVRLRPGATERVAFGGSPVTDVRINAEGLRGPDLPPPSDDEVIVVGDSQVFGLGVNEDETAAAALGRALKKTVINAGVPTYGPPEYNALLEELLAKRKAKTVVYVVTFANDFFEAARPNVERHAVWDGWAVRSETAPTRVTKFPGRELLYSRSHLVYALRRAFYDAGKGEIDDRGGYPSEGTARDLLGRAASVRAEKADEGEALSQEAQAQRIRARFLEVSTRAAELTVEEKISRAFLADAASHWDIAVGESNPGITYRAARANPGDVVAPNYGEEGRDTVASAALVREGALLRTKLEADVAAKAASDPKFAAILKDIEARDALTRRLAEARAAPVRVARAASPLLEQIKRAKAICDERGARLLVVGLPMDIMVFSSAFAKYGSAPMDLSPVGTLMNDLVESTEDLGGSALDATAALAAAGEGAFLPREFHLTPKGHKALADAMTAALAAPTKLRGPEGLPLGRSPLPRPDEWKVHEITVHGSSAAGCTTKRVREYFSVRCYGRGGDASSAPVGVALRSGGGGDALAFLRDGTATVIAPILPGEELRAELFWRDRTQELVIPWLAGDVVADGRFEKKSPPKAPPPSDDAPEVCACYKEINKAASCGAFLGDGSAACVRTYAGDCKATLACAEGDPGRRPACGAGEANVGALGRCRTLCDEARPCAKGSCVPYGGSRICAG